METVIDKGQALFLLAIVFVLYIAPVVASLIDLRFGIKKARERGEEIDSDHLKKTPAKITNYLLFIFAVSVVDVVQMAIVHYLSTFYGWHSIPLLPVLTAVASVGCCGIEVKSIYENNDTKTKREAKQIAIMAKAILKAHGDIQATADAVGGYLNKESDGNDKEGE